LTYIRIRAVLHYWPIWGQSRFNYPSIVDGKYHSRHTTCTRLRL